MTTTKFTNPLFSKENISGYNLIFEIKPTLIRTVIHEEKKLLKIEEHYIGDGFSINMIGDNLEEILKTHPYLSDPGWKSVEVVTSFHFYAFLPKSDFREDFASKYIKYSFPKLKIEKFSIFTQELKWDFMAYAIPKPITEIFIKFFLHTSFYSTFGIGAAFINQNSDIENLLIFSKGFLEHIVKDVKNKRIKYEKSFDINLRESLESEIILFGEITELSSVYKDLIRENNKKITFGKVPDSLDISESFSDILLHRYFYPLILASGIMNTREKIFE